VLNGILGWLYNELRSIRRKQLWGSSQYCPVSNVTVNLEVTVTAASTLATLSVLLEYKLSMRLLSQPGHQDKKHRIFITLLAKILECCMRLLLLCHWCCPLISLTSCGLIDNWKRANIVLTRLCYRYWSMSVKWFWCDTLLVTYQCPDFTSLSSASYIF
jgi:hypothetical protein